MVLFLDPTEGHLTSMAFSNDFYPRPFSGHTSFGFVCYADVVGLG